MRILVIDDHRLFVSGLRFLLSDLHADLEITEIPGVESIDAAAAEDLDMVLLDLKLSGLSGIPALDRVRAQLEGVPIVALSSEENGSVIRECIEHGAAGFVPKSSSPEVLIHALRLILAGGIYLPALVLSTPNEETARVDPADDPRARSLAALSDRQRQALMLAVKGKSNKHIARELGIAEGTVKLHLSAAYRSLGVGNRIEAVFAVAELGLVEPTAS